jgi:putative nucleotidyltransferase with HDIG domain
MAPVRRRRRRSSRRDRINTVLAIGLTLVVLTLALGQRFYRQPELQVETVAPETIVAPRDVTVEDTETTEADRAAARTGAKPVLVPNPSKNEQIRNIFRARLTQANALREQAAPFPLPTLTDTLSLRAQGYLRQAPEAEWQTVQTLTGLTPRLPAVPTQAQLADNSTFRALSPIQREAVLGLVTLQRPLNDGGRRALLDSLNALRSRYQQARRDLAQAVQADGQGLPGDARFLDLSDEDWRRTRQEMQTALERMLLQGIAPGVPDDILYTASRRHLQGNVPPSVEEFAAQLLSDVLEFNLEPDPERTLQKAEDAAEKVPPVMVSIQAGEPIVRQGDVIDRTAFVLLDEFNLSQRRFNLWGLVLFGVPMAGGIAIFLLAERTVRPALRRRDHGLVICSVLCVSGLNVLGTAVYSLPAIGLLLGSFYGATLGTTVVGVLMVWLPIGTRVGTIPLLASAAGALVSSLIAHRLRSREELALLGLVAGLIQGLSYLILTWVLNPFNQVTWYLPIAEAAKQGGYGLISSVVALGISPYLEHLFDLVTPIRLAELSNPNRPLLKRLAAEAPGTFQHTLFVASLAEAAAQALNCNVELVRAGTLYHDIGKMHDPQGFIENQMGGPNKHDTLNNPWQSAAIIKKHVSEGLVMARRCRLPKALQAFIPEHQGTMLISYFYHQAKEQGAEGGSGRPVREADFRYDGPIPQSPETGIVMLADSCEAALRSLKEATHEEALAMVNRILKARWRDSQLIDSGFTREHMAVIAQVFVQVWQQYNHKRIAYPKASLSPAIGR